MEAGAGILAIPNSPISCLPYHVTLPTTAMGRGEVGVACGVAAWVTGWGWLLVIVRRYSLGANRYPDQDSDAPISEMYPLFFPAAAQTQTSGCFVPRPATNLSANLLAARLISSSISVPIASGRLMFPAWWPCFCPCLPGGGGPSRGSEVGQGKAQVPCYVLPVSTSGGLGHFGLLFLFGIMHRWKCSVHCAEMKFVDDTASLYT